MQTKSVSNVCRNIFCVWNGGGHYCWTIARSRYRPVFFQQWFNLKIVLLPSHHWSALLLLLWYNCCLKRRHNLNLSSWYVRCLKETDLNAGRRLNLRESFCTRSLDSHLPATVIPETGSTGPESIANNRLIDMLFATDYWCPRLWASADLNADGSGFDGATSATERWPCAYHRLQWQQLAKFYNPARNISSATGYSLHPGQHPACSVIACLQDQDLSNWCKGYILYMPAHKYAKLRKVLTLEKVAP